MIFGTKQDKDLRHLHPIVEQINAQEDWAKSFSDDNFPTQTEILREKLSQGATLNDIRPQAFALAREAALRVLGERHYDVQMMGAVVLHEGNILEMKTGEGKTLTCVPAAYLNALEGKGVHIITVNDYLAERDSQWMGPVFEFLGLSVGVILSNMDNEQRRLAYSRDITYGTNNEFGFDYLRDNMKWAASEKIQPQHHYCIIDEIDSILIDEARTPLIISGQAEDDSRQVNAADRLAPLLIECEKNPETNDYYEEDPLARFDKGAPAFDPKGDYKIDEKQKRITFTTQGISHIEELLLKNKVIAGSLYEDENFEFVHYVTQAVKAHHLFRKDVEYVVADGQVQIVDEFTGRILHGRRYSDGLHQAIEAKEHIKVLGQNKTLATITFQNFFRMYDKISGMTGTADTEAAEFNSIYGIDVVVIPTNRPVAREDLHDLVFYNEPFKLTAICKEIAEVHTKGQPILVGTVSIEKSELISAMLKRMGIPHEVLNAKNHAREAHIIEEAGAKGAVTIATNMAGRGTDIKLGGSLDARARRVCGTDASPAEFQAALEKVRPAWKAAYEEVKSLGGLYVLGTERHESRRIDNQLRGRSGRQGDPGTSRFYVSLDDTLMRLFANDNLKKLLGRAGMSDGEPIEHKMLSNAIEKAQKRVEERNFEIRKHLLDFDDVLNEQRNIIYEQRDDILMDENLVDRALLSCADSVFETVQAAMSDPQWKERSLVLLMDALQEKLNYKPTFLTEDMIGSDPAALAGTIQDHIVSEVREKVALAGDQQFNNFLRFHYLRQIDMRWQDHLEDLEALRDAVYLRTYAQKNPLVEYKVEGFEIFETMLGAIKSAIARTIVNVQVRTGAPAERKRPAGTMEAKHSGTSPFMSAPQQSGPSGETSPVTVKRTYPKVGRNEPCPCGSGKKYKNCHGKTY